MKKFFALFMAVVMLISLAACGNKTVTESTPETTEQTKPVDKQAQYEEFFTTENFKTAGESVKIGSEYADISVVQDNSGNVMLEISVLENYMRIYHLQDGKQYVNMKIAGEDGNAEETWTEYKSENAEDAIDSADLDMSAAEIELDTITKVEYVETKDGKDVVKVYQQNPEYDETVETVKYNITFKYNDADCEMLVTVETDAEGGVGTSYEVVNAPEEFDSFGYSMDLENKVLVNDMDETEEIPFEIKSQEEVVPEKEVSYDVYIDEATKSVTSMQGMIDGEFATVEFFTVESCMDGVEIPETVDECNEEDLAMAILTILFSAMDFEAE